MSGIYVGVIKRSRQVDSLTKIFIVPVHFSGYQGMKRMMILVSPLAVESITTHGDGRYVPGIVEV